MHRSRRAIPLVVAAILGSGCSGGGGGDEAGVVPQPPGSEPAAVQAVPPSTANAAPPPTATPLVAKAAAATLQAGDFPTGFAAQPEEPGQGLQIDRLWEELTRCLGVDAAVQRTAASSSPTFLRGLATQARSTVEYTSDATATAVATAVAGPRFQTCATDAFAADVKRSAPEGAVPGRVTVTSVPAPPAAPRATAIRVNVILNLDELTIPLFQDFLVVAERGSIVRMWFLNPGSEFPQELQRSLVEKVVSRL